jgi:hypothetical protein
VRIRVALNELAGPIILRVRKSDCIGSQEEAVEGPKKHRYVLATYPIESAIGPMINKGRSNETMHSGGTYFSSLLFT